MYSEYGVGSGWCGFFVKIGPIHYLLGCSD